MTYTCYAVGYFLPHKGFVKRELSFNYMYFLFLNWMDCVLYLKKKTFWILDLDFSYHN